LGHRAAYGDGVELSGLVGWLVKVIVPVRISVEIVEVVQIVKIIFGEIEQVKRTVKQV
jgi:hypothetical protein